MSESTVAVIGLAMNVMCITHCVKFFLDFLNRL